jgi:hypothetical protein
MIITQKYHSIKEIDLEFIPGLEQLLSDCIPSFAWLKDFEQNAPSNIHFIYYLFFGDGHNSPVGFAQMLIENPDDQNKPSFFTNFFKKKTLPIAQKKAKWLVPGTYQEALVVEPRYKRLALNKAAMLFEEVAQREDILSQHFCLADVYNDLPSKLSSNMLFTQERIICDTLTKNQKDYQDYLRSLDAEIAKSIMAKWKDLHKLGFSISSDHIFKEVFAYKDEGLALYKSLKNDARIKKYLTEKTEFIALQNGQKILAIIFLIQGINHHYFYDFYVLEDILEEEILHQIAIMHFYDKEDSHRLHLMFTPSDNVNLKNFGFTHRKQYDYQITSCKK